MFKCASGKHVWTRQYDAEKCCNGYRRILVPGGGDRQLIVSGVSAGFEWVPVVDSYNSLIEKEAESHEY